jgi:hypothetical protein
MRARDVFTDDRNVDRRTTKKIATDRQLRRQTAAIFGSKLICAISRWMCEAVHISQ